MRKKYTVFLFIIILALIGNTYVLLEKDAPFPAEPYDLSVEAPNRYMSYPVYFVGQNRLVEIREKTRGLWQDRYENIKTIYLDQANKEIEGRALQILDIPINKLLIVDDRIYIYTEAAAFDDERYNRGNFHYYVMSLVNSLTESGRDKTVYFIFDESTRAPQLYGLDMNQGFTYDQSLVGYKFIYSEYFMRQFFLDMYKGDYRSAYRKIGTQAQSQFSHEDFAKAFKNYIFHHNNEFPWDFLMDKKDYGYDARVVFPPNSGISDELWYLDFKRGRMEVYYPQEFLEFLP